MDLPAKNGDTGFLIDQFGCNMIACKTITPDHKDSLAQQTHLNIIGQRDKHESWGSFKRGTLQRTMLQNILSQERSECKVFSENGGDQIHTHTYTFTDSSQLAFSSIIPSDFLSRIQQFINFHQIHSNQFPLMRQSSYNMDRFPSSQPISKSRTRLSDNIRIDPIDIEGKMKGVLIFWIEVFQSLLHDITNSIHVNVVHGEAFHSMFGKIHIFVGIDISNSDQNDVPRIEFGVICQPFPVRKRRDGCYSSQMRQRHAMIVLTVNFVGVSVVRIGAIGVSINPDNSQVAVQSLHARNGCSSDGMISPNSQQKLMLLLLHNIVNRFVQSSQDRSQHIQIPHSEVDRWILIEVLFCGCNVTVILDLDVVIVAQEVEESSLPKDVGTTLNSFHGLSFAESCSQEGERPSYGLSDFHVNYNYN